MEATPAMATVPVAFLESIVSRQLRESREWREVVEAERLDARKASAARDKATRTYQRWVLILRSVFIGFPILLSLLWFLFTMSRTSDWSFGPMQEVVGVVPISGEITSNGLASADKVVPALERAFASKHTKAVVLKINSPGGLPLESERVNSAVAALKTKHKKPVIAVIENVGASAAYMIAMHADKVCSGRYSLVGSIGAVMSGWDVHKAMEKLRVGRRTYASGGLKAMMDPFAPQSPAADKKAQGLVSSMGAAFVGELKAARGQHLKPNVDYTTGEVWYGEQAKDLGLVDDLCTLEDIINRDFPGTSAHMFGPKQAGVPFLSTRAGEFNASEAIDELLARAWPSIR
jgi:protease-4